MLYFKCGNYIVQAEKHIALPNQTYLWFASMDFLYFFTNYKQDHRLESDLKLVRLSDRLLRKSVIKKKNVYRDTLYMWPEQVWELMGITKDSGYTYTSG